MTRSFGPSLIRLPASVWLTLVLILLASMTRPTVAQEAKLSAADLLPGSTALYVEFKNPADLIAKVEQHPLAEKIQSIKQVKTLMASPQFAMAVFGKTFVEKQLGETILESVKTNLSEGVAFAIDTETDGVVLIGKSSDEAKLKRLLGTILKFATQAAEREGREAPYKVDEYRGAKAAEFEGGMLVRHGSWVIVTNKSKLAKRIVDNLKDGAKGSLSDQTWFKQSAEQATNSKHRDGWAAVDLDTLRKAGVAKELFIGKTDNPGVELFMGGVLDALKNAPVAVANLGLDKDLNLSVATPFKTGWANEHREFFFGKKLSGVAPNPLLPEKMVASMTTYRDIAGWWLAKEELFEENVIAGLAQADSQLSTVFSGMDFGQDILGALEPGVQIVVAENEFDKDYTPDVKLPSFALVGTLKQPKKIQPRLNIAFQSAIGITNLNLGMQGQPQLSIETERIGEGKVSAANYYYDEDTEKGLMLFNFSPTIAFQGNRLIISSNRSLAVELSKLAAKHPEGMKTDSVNDVNTRVKLDAKMLEKILSDNRESLIANNMIEEGNSRKQAEQQIEIVMIVAKLLRDAKVEYSIDDSEMKLEFQLRTNN